MNQETDMVSIELHRERQAVNNKYADPSKREVRIITPIKESKWLTKWVGSIIIALLIIVIALMAVAIGNQNQLYRLGNRESYRTKYEKELEINSEITKKYLDLLTTKETTNEGG